MPGAPRQHKERTGKGRSAVSPVNAPERSPIHSVREEVAGRVHRVPAAGQGPEPCSRSCETLEVDAGLRAEVTESQEARHSVVSGMLWTKPSDDIPL